MAGQHARPGPLLQRADRLLMDAAGEDDPGERFLAAYLAALRGAAAVLAATESTRPARERSRNAWVLMSRAAPEFVMWSDYFADHSATRAALEAGITREVTDAQAEAVEALFAGSGLVGRATRSRRKLTGRASLSSPLGQPVGRRRLPQAPFPFRPSLHPRCLAALL